MAYNSLFEVWTTCRKSATFYHDVFLSLTVQYRRLYELVCVCLAGVSLPV